MSTMGTYWLIPTKSTLWSWSSIDKRPRRSLPHSVNRQMPCVWIKVRGRQVLGAGLWVASRSPASRAQGCPHFLHQWCLCAQTSPHALSNDCTDQIPAHQPPHIVYSHNNKETEASAVPTVTELGGSWTVTKAKRIKWLKFGVHVDEDWRL